MRISDWSSDVCSFRSLGYERRLGKRGVVGVNFFYRDIKNLIELVNTGEPSDEMIGTWEDLVDDGEYATVEEAMAAEPADSWVFTSANVGDGKVYGVERSEAHTSELQSLMRIS